ncbi:3-phosphoglycerate dehydrogenase [Streptomonospora sp. PA3]|uniref:NAD(P)-dependent oxidoreductase n=1 Tax=Streptomonospora sp. PA3 TaxID=2607326 RepID=UPI00130BA3AB|nr:3-phosphoglycerate dehydrogenase [Streptomonospora sp. PA3]
MADPLDPAALAELSRTYDLVDRPGCSQPELQTLVQEAEVLVVRSGVQVTAEIIAAAPRLRVLARAGSGLDNIDLAAAADAGVTVFNVPGASAGAVAELGLGMLMGLMRQIPSADRGMRSGRWQKRALTGREVAGSAIGVVGLGRIGMRFAELALRLDARVRATVRRSAPERARELGEQGIDLVSLEELLAESDAVCLAVPLTAETRELVGGAELRLMGGSAYLVNVSRGGVVDERALFDALAAGTIAGAALDVHQREGGTTPLAQLENVVLTPHIGAMTHEAQQRIGRTVVDFIGRALDGRPIPTRLC